MPNGIYQHREAQMYSFYAEDLKAHAEKVVKKSEDKKPKKAEGEKK